MKKLIPLDDLTFEQLFIGKVLANLQSKCEWVNAIEHVKQFGSHDWEKACALMLLPLPNENESNNNNNKDVHT